MYAIFSVFVYEIKAEVACGLNVHFVQSIVGY